MIPAYKVVIPARLHSTRLPKKLLLDLAGMSILQRTWMAVCNSHAEQVIIAVDDEQMADHAQGFGAQVVMTNQSHESGTDRAAEVAVNLNWHDDDIIINCQADEPFIPPRLIDDLAVAVALKKTMVTIAVKAFHPSDPNAVKVVINKLGQAIYFSRAEIPFNRDENGLNQSSALRHIGIYGWTVSTLKQICALPVSQLEQIEKLEQLRVIENGIPIYIVQIEETFQAGIDTLEDLHRCRNFINH